VRYFTPKEAEALIPELEKIYKTIGEIVARAEVKAQKARRLEESGSDAAALAIERSQLQFLAGSANELLKKIVDLGAEPKGLAPALVDFPHRLGGRDVYLCWKLGDKKITHYHGMDEGFAGRRRLPS
jgi:hypothetical protein